MNFNWNEIKAQVKLNCTNAFAECSLVVSDQELNDSLTIFKNFIQYPSQYNELKGLETDFCEALMKTFKEEPGNKAYLDTIGTDFEPFFRKIIIMLGIDTYNNVTGNGKTLWPLFRKLNITPNFISSGLGISSINPNDYITNNEGIYIIKKAYDYRNEVHKANALDFATFGLALKYCIATYVWVIYKLKNQLITFSPDFLKEYQIINPKDQDNGYIYDFLSFGKTANEIKNQFVNSFILNKIFCQSSIKVSDIINEVKDFSQGSLSEKAIKRILDKLSTQRKIKYINIGQTEIELTNSEKDRLVCVSEKYQQSLTNFKNSVKSEMDKYGIPYDLQVIIDLFADFLTDNFSNEISVEDSVQLNNYSSLSRKIIELGYTQNQTNEIFKNIILLCKSNSILYKLSYGKVFSKLSNNNTLLNISKAPERIVFLDTQIVLHILCLLDDLPQPIKGIKLVAKHIIDIANNTSNHIKLFVAKTYIKEVIRHFRQALELLQITKNPKVDGFRGLSYNVFYSQYVDLKNNDDLPNDISSFKDYMQSMYELKERDLYAKNFNKIVENIITDILEDKGITVETIPHYSEDELEPVQEVFNLACKNNDLALKDNQRLKLDSIMGKYLFDDKTYQTPFFLTMDKTFQYFKAEYIGQYKRNIKSYIWLLKTPSQFVNHIDLINLKIDEKKLSNDLLSLIENEDFEFKTYTAIDKITRFLHTPTISEEQREKNMKNLMKKLVKDEKEFDSQIETIVTEDDPNVELFGKLSNEIYSHYLVTGGNELSKYCKIFETDESFNTYVEYIQSICSSNTNINNINRQKIFEKISSMNV